MEKTKDLIGQKFFRMTVIKRVENSKHNTRRWLCQCDCGNECIIEGCKLRSNHTKSCGCLTSNGRKSKHGHAKIGNYSRTYSVWNTMKQRCANSNNSNYKNYGGRGIKVCDRWLKFENFLEDMGERPDGLSLDRKDNNLGYYKENCRWATQKQQHRNMSTTCLIEYGGKLVPRIELAELYDIHPDTLRRRLKNGLTIEEALLSSKG